MTGCDCGGNAHNEEHADDCAGWRLEVERLRGENKVMRERHADEGLETAQELSELRSELARLESKQVSESRAHATTLELRLQAEIARLREAIGYAERARAASVRQAVERQREACAQVAAQAVEPAAVGGYGRHLMDDTLEAVRATPLVEVD